MKEIYVQYKITLLLLLSMGAGVGAAAQDKGAVAILKLAYFDNDNKVPLLRVTVLEKRDGRLSPAPGVPVRLFLGDSTAAGSIGKVITDAQGLAAAGIPAGLQDAWKSAAVLHFVAASDAFRDAAPQAAGIDITRARLLIDTVAGEDGARTVHATLQAWQGGGLVNVKGAEIKIGVRRLGSYLAVGDAETYTTDSTGTVAAIFARTGLPGDAQGNLVVTARVEDNDSLGNLSVSAVVPWGVRAKADDFGYGRRSIWATNDKAPLSLMMIAYTLIAGVWCVLLYLVRMIWQIRKMGRTEAGR